MNRIRGEQLTSTIGHYLKKRHFMDAPAGEPAQKRECGCTQSMEELVLTTSVVQEGSMGNSISYSSISGDATACDQQYNRIKLFLKEAREPYREELQPLLYPLFVHVYLELLCNGQKTPAHKFYSRHHIAFKDNGSYQAVLQALQGMYKEEDVQKDKQISEFREHKYTITMSASAMDYLFRYLKHEDNVLMLQLFNQHIDIHVEGGEMSEDIHQQEDRLTESNALVSPPVTPENKVIQNEITLSSLQKCIRTVRDGPPSLSSVCLYTFLNTYQGLCSASISPDEQLLSAGFEDSSVHVWSLSTKPISLDPCQVNNSRIHLAGDVLEDVLENNKVSDFEEVETLRLQGHCGPVYSTAFTHDSRYLLSASEDKTVRLWDMDTGTNKVSYRGHSYPVWGVAASPVCSYFASCSHDRTAKLWCTERAFPLRSFIGHLADVDCISFHPNCSYLATGSSDRTVRLWNIQDGRPVRLFQGHMGTVLTLAFSPNGQLLASAGEDRRIRVWDLTAGSLLKELKGHTDVVYALSFNRDSTVLTSGGQDCVVRLWDVRKTASPPRRGSTSHTAANSLDIHRDLHSSAELMASYNTKATAVHFLQYSKRNLLLAAGSLVT